MVAQGTAVLRTLLPGPAAVAGRLPMGQAVQSPPGGHIFPPDISVLVMSCCTALLHPQLAGSAHCKGPFVVLLTHSRRCSLLPAHGQNLRIWQHRGRPAARQGNIVRCEGDTSVSRTSSGIEIALTRTPPVGWVTVQPDTGGCAHRVPGKGGARGNVCPPRRHLHPLRPLLLTVGPQPVQLHAHCWPRGKIRSRREVPHVLYAAGIGFVI